MLLRTLGTALSRGAVASFARSAANAAAMTRQATAAPLSVACARGMAGSSHAALEENASLRAYVDEWKAICKPDNVYVCDGSAAEFEQLARTLEASNTIVRLNPEKRPNSFLARSDPRDVARSEGSTYICSERQEDAGPTNNWKAPADAKADLLKLYDGCMTGRTMYVVPFMMGPVNSPYSKIGVELTDSPYVALSMHVMTIAGESVLERLRQGQDFVHCVHSVGHPLAAGEADVAWPCNPNNRMIAHFPDEEEELKVWSFGSAYGGNSLLGKKCLALRLASVMGRKEGWLAEHMLILGIENAAGVKKYIAAAFPSQCGKTNLAMIEPTLPGYKVTCVGDDIAWLNFGPDGRLYAINPEAGFFGVAPGTSDKTNYNAMRSLDHDAVFTNVALTKDGDVWWEGMGEKPDGLTTWLNEADDGSKPAAHPNSRFAVRAEQCPTFEQSPDNGVPIDAIVFGGRRPTTVPLVLEANSWLDGVITGASVSSGKTAAADDAASGLRHDPFAQLPFMGYNMGEYFGHWLSMQEREGAQLPKVFQVNWFRQNDDGDFMWPGFGENTRVLDWIFKRTEGEVGAIETPIGKLPTAGALNTDGIDVPADVMDELLSVNTEQYVQEYEGIIKYFESYGGSVPQPMMDRTRAILDALRQQA